MGEYLKIFRTRNEYDTVVDTENEPEIGHIIDEAAIANWGGSWRMPTEADFAALNAATTNAWVTDYQGSGINGRLFTDKTDSSKVLFFPAAGYCYGGSVSNVGSFGSYWSSSLGTNYMTNGMSLSFNSGSCNIDNNNRRFGYSVRGVAD